MRAVLYVTVTSILYAVVVKTWSLNEGMQVYKWWIQRVWSFIKVSMAWESTIILSSTAQQLLHCKFACYPDNSGCSYHVQDISGTELIMGRRKKVILIPSSCYLAIKVRMPQRRTFFFLLLQTNPANFRDS